MLVVTAQELWRLDSPDRFTTLAYVGAEAEVLYDGPSQADAEDVARVWHRSHSDGTAVVLSGEWAA